MQGCSWAILKGTQNYGVRYLGRLRPSVGEAPWKLMDLNRFDGIKNSYFEPTVHCHYVVIFGLFKTLFKYVFTTTY